MTMEQGDSNKPPVVIVGAGPSGLMTAIVLTDAGVPVEIYERNLKPTTEWRAPGIHSRTIEMFARYGLSEKLTDAGNSVDKPCFIRNGQRFPGMSVGLIRSEFPFILGCAQDITEGIHVKWGWEYTSYEVVGNSEHIKITLKKAFYMIGCDGGRSMIRKFDGRFVDYRIAVCDLEVDVDWLPVVSFVINDEGMLGTIRAHKGNKYRVFTSWSADAPELTPDSLMEAIKRRVHPYDLKDPRILSFSVFSINERRASQYISNDGRVFICGDAAHVHSPAGGQGMNTGLQDAENLAWKVGMVYNGLAKPELLKSYEIERTSIMVSRMMPLMKYMPLFILRPQMEKTSQLRIEYPAAEHCSSFADSQGWTKATSSWFPFNWFSDPLLHNQSFKAVLFIDYRITESCKDNDNSNASDVNTRQLSDDTIAELKRVMEAFQAYQSPVRPAFVIHNIPGITRVTTVIPEYANKMIKQLNNEFTSVPVFVDMNQEDRYDNMTMADLYTCSRMKQHAVYLIRPDTYVSARMLLSEAATLVRNHLDTICLSK
ncbi:FAD binding domain-containing protein [Syncephalis plumigaleata]|nr:FAD binding domain-containing protein [Syncephalis plumigaleata]